MIENPPMTALVSGLGPAVIVQLDSSTLLFPGDRATVDPHLNLMVELT